jgi:hypothetical protein
MPAYHHRLPRNTGKLGINDSISNNPETVRFESAANSAAVMSGWIFTTAD